MQADQPAISGLSVARPDFLLEDQLCLVAVAAASGKLLRFEVLQCSPTKERKKRKAYILDEIQILQ